MVARSPDKALKPVKVQDLEILRGQGGEPREREANVHAV
jgi:hypothetical protein